MRFEVMKMSAVSSYFQERRQDVSYIPFKGYKSIVQECAKRKLRDRDVYRDIVTHSRNMFNA